MQHGAGRFLTKSRAAGPIASRRPCSPPPAMSLWRMTCWPNPGQRSGCGAFSATRLQPAGSTRLRRASNRASSTRWRFGPDLLIALMLRDPLLIRRPLIEAEGRRCAGFDREPVLSLLGETDGTRRRSGLLAARRAATPCPAPAKKGDAATVVAYHNRTKHGFGGYAAGPDTLDWDMQPNPFREFDGADRALICRWRRKSLRACPTLRQGGAGRVAASFHGPVGLEGIRARSLGSALQSLQRQSPSDRSLCRRPGRRGSRRWPLPLCQPRPCPGAAASGPKPIRRARACGSACPRSIGARPGNTASAPSAIASTTSVTRWPVFPMRPAFWAFAREWSRASTARRSATSSASTAATILIAPSPKTPICCWKFFRRRKAAKPALPRRPTATPGRGRPICSTGGQCIVWPVINEAAAASAAPGRAAESGRASAPSREKPRYRRHHPATAQRPAFRQQVLHVAGRVFHDPRRLAGSPGSALERLEFSAAPASGDLRSPRRGRRTRSLRPAPLGRRSGDR